MGEGLHRPTMSWHQQCPPCNGHGHVGMAKQEPARYGSTRFALVSWYTCMYRCAFTLIHTHACVYTCGQQEGTSTIHLRLLPSRPQNKKVLELNGAKKELEKDIAALEEHLVDKNKPRHPDEVDNEGPQGSSDDDYY